MEGTNQGKLIILTGPTASGKDAIMHLLLKLHPDYERIITSTTRKPRDLERNGIDYNFISKEQFEEMDSQGEFLEKNRYAENFYATPKKEFQKVLDGKTIVWRIDPTMAARAKEFFKTEFDEPIANKLTSKTIVIYIYSNPEAMRERLSRRGMEVADVERRIEQDTRNWDECKEKFDEVVENEEGQLDETVKKVISIIEKLNTTS